MSKEKKGNKEDKKKPAMTPKEKKAAKKAKKESKVPFIQWQDALNLAGFYKKPPFEQVET